MDAISGNSSDPLQRVYKSAAGTARSQPSVSSEDGAKVSITSISDLAQKADESGEDVRPEVIERAKALLDDPSWLSDDNIDAMVEKVMKVEDF